jgi:hypothetical protein
LDGRSKREIFFFGLESTAAALEKAGKKVIIYIDVPELPFFPQFCIPRRFSGKLDNCTISRVVVEKRQHDFRSLLTGIKRLHPDIGLFDSLDAICGINECSVINHGILLYFHPGHLSFRGSEKLAERFLLEFGQ